MLSVNPQEIFVLYRKFGEKSSFIGPWVLFRGVRWGCCDPFFNGSAVQAGAAGDFFVGAVAGVEHLAVVIE